MRGLSFVLSALVAAKASADERKQQDNAYLYMPSYAAPMQQPYVAVPEPMYAQPGYMQAQPGYMPAQPGYMQPMYYPQPAYQ